MMRVRNKTVLATAVGIPLVFLGTTLTADASAAPIHAPSPVRKIRTAIVATQDARVLTFLVPVQPTGYTLGHATLTVRVARPSRGRIVLTQAPDHAGHRGVSPRAARALDIVDTSVLTSGRHTVRFDVSNAVKSGRVSFAVSASSGRTTLRTGSPGRHTAPRLVLTYKPAATLEPAPTTGPSLPAPIPAPIAAPVKPAPPAAPTVAPNTSPTPTPVFRIRTRIGMSAPATEWSSRLGETGNVDARRIFGNLSTPSGALNTASAEVAAGRMPILSFKVPDNDWAGVAAGKFDAQLRDLTSRLAAFKAPVFVTLHHEPAGDGTPADYSAMMVHALPILSGPATVDAGPIVNGFWWSNGSQGLTDAEIAQWLPASVLKASEVVAADTYQGGTTINPGEDAGVKIANMSKWATRVGVSRLGIGEYNGLNAASITAAGNALLADPRFSFAAVFNSNENNRPDVSWQLTGDRLAAFRATLAQARAVPIG
jgi:hypothetical protein